MPAGCGRQRAPKDSALERKARNLMAQGKVSEACALYGIELHERVRRLAAGQSFQRFSPAPEPGRKSCELLFCNWLRGVSQQACNAYRST
jgi:hypothetical protein